MFTSTPLQTTTYLLGVCLFSISFLVFLNSSLSFVIRDLIGVSKGVGDLVGTLGFADEVVALVACPLWGIVSDRVGVRTVCVLGYGIVGLALFLFVQANNVYPQLLLARIFFSLGGAATSTMVTAVLPSMIIPSKASTSTDPSPSPPSHVRGVSRSTAASVSSELTITPARLAISTPATTRPEAKVSRATSPPRLAGLVGIFTGCGALVALALFLPLPARLSKWRDISAGQAVADSYYVVGALALVISGCCFIGLRNLQGEEEKGWASLWGGSKHDEDNEAREAPPPYWRLFRDAIALGFEDGDVGLAYVGGFVARASSVGITLFIPLFVNGYYVKSGLCKGDPTNGTAEMKENCRQAYILAAELGGISQLTALVLAPIAGYLSDRYRRYNLPLLVGAVGGVVGNALFGALPSPEPRSSKGGGPAVFFLAALLGFSQISAIVCSLGLLGRCVLGDEDGGEGTGTTTNSSDAFANGYGNGNRDTSRNDSTTHPTERSPLLTSPFPPSPPSSPPSPPAAPSSSSPCAEVRLRRRERYAYKGSLSGIYSLTGGLGILLLTKGGGVLFDRVSFGAPFYLLSGFNGLLVLVAAAVGVRAFFASQRRKV